MFFPSIEENLSIYHTFSIFPCSTSAFSAAISMHGRESVLFYHTFANFLFAASGFPSQFPGIKGI
jgi:hypothetical protein